MLKRVIPVLLLSGRGLVKTQKFGSPKYVGDPINAVKIFSEKEADEIVFLDIEATRLKRDPDFNLIRDISSEAYMPFAYGGGVHSLAQAERILRNGAEKIVLTSVLLSNPGLARRMIGEFGASTVVTCVDVKKKPCGTYGVYSHVDGKIIPTSLKQHLQICREIGFGEVIVQSVDRDGEMSGYDTALLSSVRPDIDAPLVALGGAGKVLDVRHALGAGADAAAAGSLFTFYGKYRAVLITYPDYNELRTVLA